MLKAYVEAASPDRDINTSSKHRPRYRSIVLGFGFQRKRHGIDSVLVVVHEPIKVRRLLLELVQEAEVQRLRATLSGDKQERCSLVHIEKCRDDILDVGLSDCIGLTDCVECNTTTSKFSEPVPLCLASAVGGASCWGPRSPGAFWMIKDVEKCRLPQHLVVGAYVFVCTMACPGKADEVMRLEVGQDELEQLRGEIHECGRDHRTAGWNGLQPGLGEGVEAGGVDSGWGGASRQAERVVTDSADPLTPLTPGGSARASGFSLLGGWDSAFCFDLFDLFPPRCAAASVQACDGCRYCCTQCVLCKYLEEHRAAWGGSLVPSPRSHLSRQQHSGCGRHRTAPALFLAPRTSDGRAHCCF